MRVDQGDGCLRVSYRVVEEEDDYSGEVGLEEEGDWVEEGEDWVEEGDVERICPRCQILFQCEEDLTNHLFEEHNDEEGFQNLEEEEGDEKKVEVKEEEEEEEELVKDESGTIILDFIEETVRPAAQKWMIVWPDPLEDWNSSERWLYSRLKQRKFNCGLCGKQIADSNLRSTHVRDVHGMIMGEYHDAIMKRVIRQLKAVIEATKQRTRIGERGGGGDEQPGADTTEDGQGEESDQEDGQGEESDQEDDQGEESDQEDAQREESDQEDAQREESDKTEETEESDESEKTEEERESDEKKAGEKNPLKRVNSEEDAGILKKVKVEPVDPKMEDKTTKKVNQEESEEERTDRLGRVEARRQRSMRRRQWEEKESIKKRLKRDPEAGQCENCEKCEDCKKAEKAEAGKCGNCKKCEECEKTEKGVDDDVVFIDQIKVVERPAMPFKKEPEDDQDEKKI